MKWDWTSPAVEVAYFLQLEDLKVCCTLTDYFVLHQITGKCINMGKEVYCIFIDSEELYDSEQAYIIECFG